MTSFLVKKKKGDSIQEVTSHFEFHFDISNMEVLKEPGRIINSPDYLGSIYGEKWRVQLSYNSPNLFDLTLQLAHSQSKEEINTTFQICVLDESNKIEFAGPVKKEIFREGRETKCHQTFILNDEGGIARFYVQLVTRRLKPTEPKSVPGSKDEDSVAQKFKSFLLSGNFADVTLTSGNSQFPASKIILAANSPVFLAMFNSNMVESKSNAVVKFEDFSDETINGFLEFIYTGQTESLEENAGELLKISEKYQVLSLKGQCEEILLKNLEIKNAVDILVLAHLYSPENLKPKIISFVNKNYKDLKNTESIQRMKKEYPQLFFDLYESVVN